MHHPLKLEASSSWNMNQWWFFEREMTENLIWWSIEERNWAVVNYRCSLGDRKFLMSKKQFSNLNLYQPEYLTLPWTKQNRFIPFYLSWWIDHYSIHNARTKHETKKMAVIKGERRDCDCAHCIMYCYPEQEDNSPLPHG